MAIHLHLHDRLWIAQEHGFGSLPKNQRDILEQVHNSGYMVVQWGEQEWGRGAGTVGTAMEKAMRELVRKGLIRIEQEEQKTHARGSSGWARVVAS